MTWSEQICKENNLVVYEYPKSRIMIYFAEVVFVAPGLPIAKIDNDLLPYVDQLVSDYNSGIWIVDLKHYGVNWYFEFVRYVNSKGIYL